MIKKQNCQKKEKERKQIHWHICTSHHHTGLKSQSRCCSPLPTGAGAQTTFLADSSTTQCQKCATKSATQFWFGTCKCKECATKMYYSVLFDDQECQQCSKKSAPWFRSYTRVLQCFTRDTTEISRKFIKKNRRFLHIKLRYECSTPGIQPVVALIVCVFGCPPVLVFVFVL